MNQIFTELDASTFFSPQYVDSYLWNYLDSCSSLLSVHGYITSVIEYKHVRQRYDAGLGWMVFIRYRVLVSKKQHQWLRFRTKFWLRTLQST